MVTVFLRYGVRACCYLSPRRPSEGKMGHSSCTGITQGSHARVLTFAASAQTATLPDPEIQAEHVEPTFPSVSIGHRRHYVGLNVFLN